MKRSRLILLVAGWFAGLGCNSTVDDTGAEQSSGSGGGGGGGASSSTTASISSSSQSGSTSTASTGSGGGDPCADVRCDADSTCASCRGIDGDEVWCDPNTLAVGEFYCGEGHVCSIESEYCSVDNSQDVVCAWSYACVASAGGDNWCPCSNAEACHEDDDGSRTVYEANCVR